MLSAGSGDFACRSAAAGAQVDPPFNRLPARDQQYHLWALRHPKCVAGQDDYLPDELAAIYARRQFQRTLGALPLIVVAAIPAEAPPGVSLPDWRREKADHMADLVRLSTRGRVLSDSLSGHHLHLDDPAIVVGAIREVVREAAMPDRR